LSKLLPVSISLLLIGVALYLFDWVLLRDVFLNISPLVFALVTLILLVEFPLLAWRWHLIVSPEAPEPFLVHLRQYMTATLVNTISPAQIGGDIYRFFKVQNNETGGLTAFALLVQERAIGLITFFIAYLLCLLWLSVDNSKGLGNAAWIFYGIGAACLFGLFAIAALALIAPQLMRNSLITRFPLIRMILETSYRALVFTSIRDFVHILTISLAVVIFWIVAIQIVTVDIGVNVPFAMLGLIGIATDLARLVPITVQGIGVRESVFAFFFSALGHSAEQGFVIGAVSYAAVSLAMVISGIAGRMIPNRKSS